MSIESKELHSVTRDERKGENKIDPDHICAFCAGEIRYDYKRNRYQCSKCDEKYFALGESDLVRHFAVRPKGKKASMTSVHVEDFQIVTREADPCLHCGSHIGKRDPLLWDGLPIYLGPPLDGREEKAIMAKAEALGDFLMATRDYKVFDPKRPRDLLEAPIC